MIHEMPRAGQKRRHAEMADQIIDAAEAIVSDEGLEALTMQRIAADLGYRAGALYRYHASKEAVQVALLGRVIEALVEAMAEVRDRPLGGAPEQMALVRLVAVGHAYLQLAETRPSLMNLVVRFLGNPAPVVSDPATADLVPRGFELISIVGGLFAEAARLGALPPGPELVRVALFWNALHGLVATRKLGRFGVINVRVLGPATVRTLLMGFGASAANVDLAISNVFLEAS